MVYIDENCQAAIIFNNLGIDFGRDTKKGLHLLWESAGDVPKIISYEWGFVKQLNQWVIQLSARELNCLLVWPC